MNQPFDAYRGTRKLELDALEAQIAVLIPVDARAVSGSINPGASGVHSLGTILVPYAIVTATSGSFEQIQAPVGIRLAIDSGPSEYTQFLGDRNFGWLFKDRDLNTMFTIFVNTANQTRFVSSVGMLFFESANNQNIHFSPHGNGRFILQGHGAPNTTNTYDFGAVAKRWRSIHATSGVFTTVTGKLIRSTRLIEGGTGPYAILGTDDFVNGDASNEAFVATLPDATALTGQSYIIKKTDATENVITVSGTQTIDGDLTFDLLAQDEVIEILSDGTEWWII